jgi:hypothetical protein
MSDLAETIKLGGELFIAIATVAITAWATVRQARGGLSAAIDEAMKTVEAQRDQLAGAMRSGRDGEVPPL